MKLFRPTSATTTLRTVRFADHDENPIPSDVAHAIAKRLKLSIRSIVEHGLPSITVFGVDRYVGEFEQKVCRIAARKAVRA